MAGRPGGIGRPGVPTSYGAKVRKDGRLVGAPPGRDTVDDFEALANEYVARTERAIDAGVDLDYFYKTGRVRFAGMAAEPADAQRMARVLAATSSQNTVGGNLGQTVKALEQEAAGAPIGVGRFPNASREMVTRALREPGPPGWMGPKHDPFSRGVGSWPLPDNPRMRRAPNDMFEFRAYGYANESGGKAQHDFMHANRQRAADIYNKKHNTNLSVEQLQELHWATARAGVEGQPIRSLGDAMAQQRKISSAAEGYQKFLPRYVAQHSWESVPGETAQHLPGLVENPEAMRSYHDQILDTMLDERGQDRLVRAMGGRFQEPAILGPGSYQGKVHPYGVQSRSLAAGTQEKGLDPLALARIRDTEMARGLLLGQDATVGHQLYDAPQPTSVRAKSKPFESAYEFNLGRPIDLGEAGKVERTMRDAGFPTSASPIPSESGFRLLSIAERGMQRGVAQVESLLGVKGARRKYKSAYDELPWQDRRAAAYVLENWSPAGRVHADSEQARAIAGNLADLYAQLAAKGQRPTAGLPELLRAWADEGVAGIERLVRSGAAPAVLLSLLGAGAVPRHTPSSGG
jgi:hypothetical protein